MREHAVPFDTPFVAAVYDRLASVYDVVFGVPLHPGRRTAIRRMHAGHGERILELGVGTGMGLTLYPRECSVTAVDVSAAMLERARARVQRHRLQHVTLMRMDAARLEFASQSFDIVYAPYFISCVPDPVVVAQEMCRVCRANGRLVFLNHFQSHAPLLAHVERRIAPFARQHFGFRSDMTLAPFLASAHLQAELVEKVNVPPIWSLVICRNASRGVGETDDRSPG